MHTKLGMEAGGLDFTGIQRIRADVCFKSSEKNLYSCIASHCGLLVSAVLLVKCESINKTWHYFNLISIIERAWSLDQTL